MSGRTGESSSFRGGGGKKGKGNHKKTLDGKGKVNKVKGKGKRC